MKAIKRFLAVILVLTFVGIPAFSAPNIGWFEGSQRDGEWTAHEWKDWQVGRGLGVTNMAVGVKSVDSANPTNSGYIYATGAVGPGDDELNAISNTRADGTHLYRMTHSTNFSVMVNLKRLLDSAVLPTTKDTIAVGLFLRDRAIDGDFGWDSLQEFLFFGYVGNKSEISTGLKGVICWRTNTSGVGDDMSVGQGRYISLESGATNIGSVSSSADNNVWLKMDYVDSGYGSSNWSKVTFSFKSNITDSSWTTITSITLPIMMRSDRNVNGKLGKAIFGLYSRAGLVTSTNETGTYLRTEFSLTTDEWPSVYIYTNETGYNIRTMSTGTHYFTAYPIDFTGIGGANEPEYVWVGFDHETISTWVPLTQYSTATYSNSWQVPYNISPSGLNLVNGSQFKIKTIVLRDGYTLAGDNSNQYYTNIEPSTLHSTSEVYITNEYTFTVRNDVDFTDIRVWNHNISNTTTEVGAHQLTNYYTFRWWDEGNKFYAQVKNAESLYVYISNMSGGSPANHLVSYKTFTATTTAEWQGSCDNDWNPASSGSWYGGMTEMDNALWWGNPCDNWKTNGIAISATYAPSNAAYVSPNGQYKLTFIASNDDYGFYQKVERVVVLDYYFTTNKQGFAETKLMPPATNYVWVSPDSPAVAWTNTFSIIHAGSSATSPVPDYYPFYNGASQYGSNANMHPSGTSGGGIEAFFLSNDNTNDAFSQRLFIYAYGNNETVLDSGYYRAHDIADKRTGIEFEGNYTYAFAPPGSVMTVHLRNILIEDFYQSNAHRYREEVAIHGVQFGVMQVNNADNIVPRQRVKYRGYFYGINSKRYHKSGVGAYPGDTAWVGDNPDYVNCYFIRRDNREGYALDALSRGQYASDSVDVWDGADEGESPELGTVGPDNSINGMGVGDGSYHELFRNVMSISADNGDLSDDDDWGFWYQLTYTTNDILKMYTKKTGEAWGVVTAPSSHITAGEMSFEGDKHLKNQNGLVCFAIRAQGLGTNRYMIAHLSDLSLVQQVSVAITRPGSVVMRGKQFTFDAKLYNTTVNHTYTKLAIYSNVDKRENGMYSNVPMWSNQFSAGTNYVTATVPLQNYDENTFFKYPAGSTTPGLRLRAEVKDGINIYYDEQDVQVAESIAFSVLGITNRSSGLGTSGQSGSSFSDYFIIKNYSFTNHIGVSVLNSHTVMLKTYRLTEQGGSWLAATEPTTEGSMSWSVSADSGETNLVWDIPADMPEGRYNVVFTASNDYGATSNLTVNNVTISNIPYPYQRAGIYLSNKMPEYSSNYDWQAYSTIRIKDKTFTNYINLGGYNYTRLLIFTNASGQARTISNITIADQSIGEGLAASYTAAATNMPEDSGFGTLVSNTLEWLVWNPNVLITNSDSSTTPATNYYDGLYSTMRFVAINDCRNQQKAVELTRSQVYVNNVSSPIVMPIKTVITEGISNEYWDNFPKTFDYSALPSSNWVSNMKIVVSNLSTDSSSGEALYGSVTMYFRSRVVAQTNNFPNGVWEVPWRFLPSDDAVDAVLTIRATNKYGVLNVNYGSLTVTNRRPVFVSSNTATSQVSNFAASWSSYKSNFVWLSNNMLTDTNFAGDGFGPFTNGYQIMKSGANVSNTYGPDTWGMYFRVYASNAHKLLLLMDEGTSWSVAAETNLSINPNTLLPVEGIYTLLWIADIRDEGTHTFKIVASNTDYYEYSETVFTDVLVDNKEPGPVPVESWNGWTNTFSVINSPSNQEGGGVTYESKMVNLYAYGSKAEVDDEYFDGNYLYKFGPPNARIEGNFIDILREQNNTEALYKDSVFQAGVMLVTNTDNKVPLTSNSFRGFWYGYTRSEGSGEKMSEALVYQTNMAGEDNAGIRADIDGQEDDDYRLYRYFRIDYDAPNVRTLTYRHSLPNNESAESYVSTWTYPYYPRYVTAGEDLYTDSWEPQYLRYKLFDSSGTNANFPFANDGQYLDGGLTNANGLACYAIRLKSHSTERWIRGRVLGLRLVTKPTVEFTYPQTTEVLASRFDVVVKVGGTNEWYSNTIVTVYSNFEGTPLQPEAWRTNGRGIYKREYYYSTTNTNTVIGYSVVFGSGEYEKVAKETDTNSTRYGYRKLLVSAVIDNGGYVITNEKYVYVETNIPAVKLAYITNNMYTNGTALVNGFTFGSISTKVFTNTMPIIYSNAYEIEMLTNGVSIIRSNVSVSNLVSSGTNVYTWIYGADAEADNMVVEFRAYTRGGAYYAVAYSNVSINNYYPKMSVVIDETALGNKLFGSGDSTIFEFSVTNVSRDMGGGISISNYYVEFPGGYTFGPYLINSREFTHTERVNDVLMPHTPLGTNRVYVTVYDSQGQPSSDFVDIVRHVDSNDFVPPASPYEVDNMNLFNSEYDVQFVKEVGNYVTGIVLIKADDTNTVVSTVAPIEADTSSSTTYKVAYNFNRPTVMPSGDYYLKVYDRFGYSYTYSQGAFVKVLAGAMRQSGVFESVVRPTSDGETIQVGAVYNKYMFRQNIRADLYTLSGVLAANLVNVKDSTDVEVPVNWDGSLKSSGIAPVGVYLVVITIETYDPSTGWVTEVIRKPVVFAK